MLDKSRGFSETVALIAQAKTRDLIGVAKSLVASRIERALTEGDDLPARFTGWGDSRQDRNRRQ
jgi:hypothetical protein